MTTAEAPTPTAEPGGAPISDAAAAGRGPGRGSGRWARRIALVATTAAAMLGLGALGFVWLQPHPYSGTVFQAPTAAPSLDGLVDGAGDPVDLARFRGDLVLVYFGYTHCPDVCPTTLSQIARALDRVGGDAERVQVLLISVDPERDDPAKLGEYARAFDPTFIGATGPVEDIERIASTYGVYFARVDDDGADGGSYDIDHTASLMGIDGDGHLRIVWPALLDVDALAADIRELL